ncbi:GerMN domain-containing protein [Litchfieldia salsa]|uniref:Germination protein M n=1 Tax=Litchfieldia salsa TaxID=930152 RepID=A0A1H0NXZ2_9BACI|nr:GerMN domain-containing protein [Litchfieldia salsa]SDO97260.1 germination protein M [Litchfieldia salsa]
MRNKTKYTIASTVIASSVLLSGCGLFGGDQTMEEIDPPQNESYTDDVETVDQEKTEGNTDVTNDEEAAQETISRELYLIDANGYVVSQAVDLPKTDGVAKQVVEYLVDGGPVSEILPTGFRAVIPRDTEVSVNMEGTTVLVDFSKEFTEYKAEDEQKILEAITWTLTQFENIEDVEISVNGHKLEEMPVNGTPITEKLSRANGINIDNSDVADITSTKPLTVYFIAESDGNEYYVPITKRIDTAEKDNVVAAVNELIKGPGLAGNLFNDIHGEVELLGSSYADGKVTLDFNEAIFGSFEEKMISTHVLNTIVLSLTEQTGIESVSITVEGEKGIVNEAGTSVSEPVNRPEKVNTGSF